MKFFPKIITKARQIITNKLLLKMIMYVVIVLIVVSFLFLLIRLFIAVIAEKSPEIAAYATTILALTAIVTVAVTAFFAFRQLNVIKAQSQTQNQLFVNGIKSSLADIKINIIKSQKEQIPYSKKSGRTKLSPEDNETVKNMERQILLMKIKYYNIFEDLCIYILYHKNKEFINLIKDHHNWINDTVKEFDKDEILMRHYKDEIFKKYYPSIIKYRKKFIEKNN